MDAISESVGLALVAGDREMSDHLLPVHHYHTTTHLLLLTPSERKVSKNNIITTYHEITIPTLATRNLLKLEELI